MTAPRTLGWDSGRDTEFAPYAGECVAGRVGRPDKGSYVVLTAAGPLRAEVSGALRHSAADPTALPTVGDWVAVRPGDTNVVEAVLPRRTAFVRHGSGNATAGQVLAANVDLVFVVVGLATKPNLRRIERFLALAWESGAQPVVLLGASGVGKSTLANTLLGAPHLATTAIRDDGKGRHTTTHRELIPLPGGAVLIDTPGLRGLQLWDAEEGLEKVFAEVEALIERCRFADCAHRTEPGCAVLAALEDGTLDPRRWESHQKLQRELHHLAAKQDVLVRIADRDRWKAIHKEMRGRSRPQTR